MPMDSKNIEELLNKYWNCETSLEEEQQLRDYLQGSNVPDQHNDTAVLFRYFGEHKKKSLNEGNFDARIVKTITPKNKIVKLFHNSMRIAAGIAVLMVALWFVRTEVQKNSQQTADTYDDPKLAFEETKKALMMISKNFGKAEQEAKKINLFNEAQKEILNNPEKEEVTL